MKRSEFSLGVRRNCLFVTSYEEIANRILDSADAPILSDSQYVYGLFGSPGTGKTSFIYYFFHRLMIEKPNCLIIWDKADSKLYFSPKTSQFLPYPASFDQAQIYEVIDVNIDENHSVTRNINQSWPIFTYSSLLDFRMLSFTSLWHHTIIMSICQHGQLVVVPLRFLHFQCGVLLFLLCIRQDSCWSHSSGYCLGIPRCSERCLNACSIWCVRR